MMVHMLTLPCLSCIIVHSWKQNGHHYLPPSSPDIALSSFFWFPNMRLKLKGKRLDAVLEIQQNSQHKMNGIMKRIWLVSNDNRIARLGILIPKGIPLVQNIGTLFINKYVLTTFGYHRVYCVLFIHFIFLNWLVN